MEPKATDIAYSPFGKVDMLTHEELRGFIGHIEKLARSSNIQIEIPIEHYFSKSVYAREMKMPKGALVIGKIHKHQNLNILSKGEASILSVDGVIRVRAPYTFVASPGAKRIIYAHTDLVWTTVHGTDETNLEKIEDEFIAKNYDEVVPLEHDEKKPLVEGEK